MSTCGFDRVGGILLLVPAGRSTQSHSNHMRKIDMQTTFQWTRARVLTLLVLAALVAAFAGAAVAYSGSATTALSSGATAKHGADDPAGDDRGSAKHGSDDPAGDDRGTAQHRGDDPARDDRGPPQHGREEP